MAQIDHRTTAHATDPDARLRLEGTVELGGTVTGEMLSTLFGERSRVTGKLDVAGDLRIDGAFRGSVTAGENLVIGEHATVQAEVSGGSVVVKGAVTGNITARDSVALQAGARVTGDITSPALSVDRGAIFDGTSRMEPASAKAKRPGR
ncbi:MAG: polymer-forming cytoskeletal protein [Chloroflexota bacterium]